MDNILATDLDLAPIRLDYHILNLQAGHTVTGVEGVPFVVEQFFRLGRIRILETESVFHIAIFQGKQIGL